MAKKNPHMKESKHDVWILKRYHAFAVNIKSFKTKDFN